MRELVSAPLITSARAVGVPTASARCWFHLTTDLHQQLTLTFANQAVVALDNAQLSEDAPARPRWTNRPRWLALLNRVSLALAQSLDLANILEIARETAITLGVPEGSAIYIDNENVLGRIVVEYPRGDLPPDTVFDLTRNEAICACAKTDPAGDRRRGERLPARRSAGADAPRRASRARCWSRWLGGKVIGVPDVVDEPRAFTMEQIELAQTIASQAAIAVQNAALFEQSAACANELETLFESAQATAVITDLNEVVRRAAQQLLAALRGDAAGSCGTTSTTR